jgi:hypothetical protein
MHEAVDVLEAAQDQPPAERIAVCQRAIASAVAVISQADDSSGVVGDAVRRLLALHPEFAAQAKPPVSRLVDWLIAFQFDRKQDYFQIDPVAYAPALGDLGLRRYRDRLQRLRDELGPQPDENERWTAPDATTRFALDWNARRLAVLDRDVDAIITTHARDRAVPRWLHETAEALAEIDRPDLAIDWAKQATDHGDGHQSLHAAQYWCALLAEHQGPNSSCPPGRRCSSAGPPRAPRATCSTPPGPTVRGTATRSWTGSRPDLAMRSRSRCSPCRSQRSRGTSHTSSAWTTSTPGTES